MLDLVLSCALGSFDERGRCPHREQLHREARERRDRCVLRVGVLEPFFAKAIGDRRRPHRDVVRPIVTQGATGEARSRVEIEERAPTGQRRALAYGETTLPFFETRPGPHLSHPAARIVQVLARETSLLVEGKLRHHVGRDVGRGLRERREAIRTLGRVSGAGGFGLRRTRRCLDAPDRHGSAGVDLLHRRGDRLRRRLTPHRDPRRHRREHPPPHLDRSHRSRVSRPWKNFATWRDGPSETQRGSCRSIGETRDESCWVPRSPRGTRSR